MNLVACAILYCSGCGVPTPIPQSELEPLFTDPSLLPNDAHEIGVVCPHCMLAGRHSLVKMRAGHFLPDTVELRAPDAKLQTICDTMLRCEERSCRSLLPLLLQVNRNTPGEALPAYRASVRFDGLTCPRGHEIRKPIDW